MTEQNKKNNRRTMLLLFVAFVVPVILAKLALEGDWFNKAATNKGQLMEPVLDFSIAYPEREKKWYLTYISDQPCLTQCELAVYSLSQLWVALGKEQDRVATAVLFTDPAQVEVAKASLEKDFLNYKTVENADLKRMFQNQPINGIFIVDALGNVILRYPLYEEKQEAVLKSRDILADMRKLLKLSRIG